MSKVIIYEFVVKEGDIFLQNIATKTIEYKVLVNSLLTDIKNEIINIESISTNKRTIKHCFKNILNKDLLKSLYPERYI